MRPRPVLMLAGIAVTIVACDNMANQPKRLPFELPASKTAEPHWPALPPAGIVTAAAASTGRALAIQAPPVKSCTSTKVTAPSGTPSQST